ncbi:hypothetical protein VFA_003622 [Vibrio furnissii CIP 102972]|nr:hypothetical protein VFA_003622 [Vibrio furnissii CIP 102972]
MRVVNILEDDMDKKYPSHGWDSQNEENVAMRCWAILMIGAG